MERINKCAKDGNDVRFLLIANILISLMALGMALGIQGFLLYKAWKAQKSTTYEVEIKAKKRVVLDENANQPDFESLNPEEDPTYVGQSSVQPEVPGWALGKSILIINYNSKILPEWMRWDYYNLFLLKIFRGFLFIYILILSDCNKEITIRYELGA